MSVHNQAGLADPGSGSPLQNMGMRYNYRTTLISLSSKVYLGGAGKENAIDGWTSDSEEMMQVPAPL